ncbi:PREDICTED: rab3 GTPase-activating protein catalytic subunit [Tarenaya hassleriana]|uniref:rab3 GTPase-activating protein catalytic subunit n=1 Tax=Tarenaya hassleriana TaxID=28532 RepID=UPI00053C5126|nr:PREDICTED: rab3 GTPase-activating protein catalytic subunit [Tarenaya hassleriana]
MEAVAPSSFVSKARTAFHSAAAKAERVFTDLKSDLDAETQSARNDDLSKDNDEVKRRGWRGAHIRTKQDWQDRLKNFRLGRKGVEDKEKVENSTMAFPFYDENMYIHRVRQEQETKASDVAILVESLNATDVNNIPPSSTVKQLAVALEAGKRAKTVKDFVASSGSSSPVKERGALSLSAVKSLVLGDKEDKHGFDPGDEDRLVSLTQALCDAESSFLSRKIGADFGSPANTSSLPKDIHAAPPDGFVVKLAEVIGSFTTLRRMALFWCRIVDELRRFWVEGKHIPGIPLDEIPDLKFCLMHQWLQVINCCLARKGHWRIASEALEAVMRQASSTDEDSDVSEGMPSSVRLLYTKSNTGEFILRLGVSHQVENLTLLETGEPVYAPITQEGPLLTEDLIRETEELVLRTGSMGAGCSQLLSDMQAYKAANPGCILEDFVRWHSPPDWTENDSSPGEGRLSTRMQKEGNLWRELWETARPVPAVKQSPLFDEDLAVEGILNCLEDIPASELFEQLFLSLLALGFVMSEPRLAKNDDLSKLFYECKDYVVTTCQGRAWTDKLDDLVQVYETVETMLSRPDEVMRSMKQTEESPVSGNGKGKNRFKRLGFIFRGKERGQKKQSEEEEEEGGKGYEPSPNRQSFSSFLDAKSSLFSKRPPRPETQTPILSD